VMNSLEAWCVLLRRMNGMNETTAGWADDDARTGSSESDSNAVRGATHLSVFSCRREIR
jgi:hypothetical protein